MLATPTHDQIGSLVPLDSGRDIPAEAKEQAAKLSIEDELHKFFLSLIESAKKKNEKEWLDIKKEWVKARNYFDGRQCGYVNKALSWTDYNLRDGEQFFKDNVYHKHIQTALMELTRGSTELSFSHISKDSRIGQLVARVAEMRYLVHKQRTFTALKVQQENLSLLFNGLALRYTYWNKNGRKERMPKFENREVAGGEPTTVCAYCDAPMTEGQPCNYCRSTESKQIASQGMQAKVISGYEDVDCGETDWLSVDPLGVTFYLQSPALEDSPYIIWEQRIITEVLQSQYPDIKIIDGTSSRDMQMKNDLDTNSPNDLYFADGKSSNSGTAEFIQAWFDAPMYANRVIKKDTQLRNGMVLKAGTKLGQYFPNGLYLAKNDKTILDVWDEDKCSKWSAAPYVTRMGTLVGAGTGVALDFQDHKNDIRNLTMRALMSDAFAKEFVNVNLLEGENVPDDPTERAHVVNLPDGAHIVGTVIDRLPPIGLPADVYALEEKVEASMQGALGTFGGASAEPLPDAVQNTATGFLTWRNMTVGRYAPMLAAKADALDREQAYQFLENDQLYLTEKQWQQAKGDYGEEAVKYFRQCDLREELIIEVVGESYLPTSKQDKQARTQAWVELTAQAQIPPASEVGAFIGEQFNIPKSILGFDAAKSKAYQILNEFKLASDQIVMQLGDIPTWTITDPIAAQIGRLVVTQVNQPIDPKLDNVDAIVDAIKDYWESDTCRTSSNVLKASIRVLMEVIDGAMVANMQADQQKQMAAQAPMMQAQQAQMQAQAEAEESGKDAENAREDEKEQRAMAGQMATKLMDSEQKDKEMAFQASEADKQRKHEAAMTKIQNKVKAAEKPSK